MLHALDDQRLRLAKHVQQPFHPVDTVAAHNQQPLQPGDKILPLHRLRPGQGKCGEAMVVRRLVRCCVGLLAWRGAGLPPGVAQRRQLTGLWGVIGAAVSAQDAGVHGFDAAICARRQRVQPLQPFLHAVKLHLVAQVGF